MPKRTDIKSILIIGAGPIVIGQACEFDYSGTQACKALKAEGYRVILVNSNPATIMTDPGLATRPISSRSRPRWSPRSSRRKSPTRCCRPWAARRRSTPRWRWSKMGVLEKYGVEMIGANAEAIDKAEDRELFREAMDQDRPRKPAKSELVHNREEALRPRSTASACRRSSARPSRWAAPAAASPTTAREFFEIVERGLDASPSARC
jgi:carbamoyl-phosphate synthase large subunit